tara:strand:- start:2 stop:508 length:507 start_codon:yes stop_codon:yes gene_type:complete
MGKSINLGSGQRPFAAPFINVDINPKWNPDVVADGAHMPMFEDGSVDLIVAHHVAEHYGCGESQPVFAECNRILRPGGSLIVCVPDMRSLAKAWLKGDISTQIYLTNIYGAFMDDEADRHKWGFIRETLTDTLMCSHFRDVKMFDWRKIPGADIAGPDFWILAMEAVK